MDILRRVARGELSPEEAARTLFLAPFRECVDLSLDQSREMRTGIGEVVFGQGKSTGQIEAALAGLSTGERPVLATRISPEAGAELSVLFPHGEYFARAGLFALNPPQPIAGEPAGEAELMVVAAGSSDMGPAMEAFGTARFLGLAPGLAVDVGVAGLHRLTPHLKSLARARAVIVLAGMEGALAGVVAGICRAPVVAVPTAVGYGASFDGLAALLAMLNSCAPGVAVVNIDNGFGAAVMAKKILDSRERA